jgi:hypothetical protein
LLALHADAVDQHVEPSVTLRRFVDARANISNRHAVDAHALAFEPGIVQRIRKRCCLALIASGHDDPRPSHCGPPGNGLTDAAIAAGYENDLAVEPEEAGQLCLKIDAGCDAVRHGFLLNRNAVRLTLQLHF